MRDTLEAFIANGGNAAFFSGNSVCWQVRSEDDGRSLVCWKQSYNQDSVYKTGDYRTLSTLWSHYLVDRPENELTGVGFLQGGYHLSHGQFMDGAGEYTVHRPEHWVYEGTNLAQDDTFGGEHTIVGYECDGCEWTLEDGLPVPTYRDGTPEGFTILATAPVRWHPDDSQWYERWEKGRTGAATMGIYTKGGRSLLPPQPTGRMGWQAAMRMVERITHNVLRRLGGIGGHDASFGRFFVFRSRLQNRPNILLSILCCRAILFNMEMEMRIPSAMHTPGAVLLISCYELGHRPIGLTRPLRALEMAGFVPDVIDIAVEPLDVEKVARARFIGISVPMHTALRLGMHLLRRIREINPDVSICMYGLYAKLNADYLLLHGVDFCRPSPVNGEHSSGDASTQLVALVESLVAVERAEARRPCPTVIDERTESREACPTDIGDRTETQNAGSPTAELPSLRGRMPNLRTMVR